MRRYPEYKNSGVEWIGAIPKHWTMTRLKYLGESIIGLSYKPENVTDDKNGTLVLRASNIQNGKPSFLDNVYVNAEVDEKLRLKAGDILICSRSGSRELIGKNMTITTKLEGITFGVFMTVFRTKFFRFISHFLNSQVFKNQSGLFLTTTINQLTINTLNNFLICFPTDEGEQAQIANFLDRKTIQIDELICIKERRIELLQEKRTVLINQVVTKGLDPTVEMKPSGVEWIGEIPMHWTISKVKHEFESLDNLRIPLNAETRGSMKLKVYDYYGASGVIDKVENYIFDEPLILIGEDGANLYLRSTPLAFKATGKYWVNNHAHVLRPKHGNIDYLTNMLESLDYIHYITGAAQPKLTNEHLMNIAVISPPTSEQDQIADFLNRKTQQIDELITSEGRKIELLKEYRQSLISEVVTGKIDVRDEI